MRRSFPGISFLLVISKLHCLIWWSDCLKRLYPISHGCIICSPLHLQIFIHSTLKISVNRYMIRGRTIIVNLEYRITQISWYKRIYLNKCLKTTRRKYLWSLRNGREGRKVQVWVERGRWRDVEISSTAVTKHGTKLYPRKKQTKYH